MFIALFNAYIEDSVWVEPHADTGYKRVVVSKKDFDISADGNYFVNNKEFCFPKAKKDFGVIRQVALLDDEENVIGFNSINPQRFVEKGVWVVFEVGNFTIDTVEEWIKL